MCTADGTVFDIVHAVPYIQKFHKHPVTGEPLELKDLIRWGVEVGQGLMAKVGVQIGSAGKLGVRGCAAGRIRQELAGLIAALTAPGSPSGCTGTRTRMESTPAQPWARFSRRTRTLWPSARAAMSTATRCACGGKGARCGGNDGVGVLQQLSCVPALRSCMNVARLIEVNGVKASKTTHSLGIAPAGCARAEPEDQEPAGPAHR